ncbi:hypothetical protein EJB05_00696, partial [Eragrostis curvula]
MQPDKREEINARRREHRHNLSPEEREQINARRRAQRQNLSLEEREETNARRRAHRQNLSVEEREETNARRRACRHSLTHEQRQRINEKQRERRRNMSVEQKEEINARQRARRQSLPPDERQILLDQRNASYAARQDAPCKESIALQCPSILEYPSSSSHACSVKKIIGNLESICEEAEEEHIAFASAGNDDTIHRKRVVPTPNPTSATIENPSAHIDDFV